MKAYSKKENLIRTKSASLDNGLFKLFITQLRNILWVEKASARTLKKILNNISSPHLTSIIENHAVVTGQQIERLETIFELIGKTAQGKKCIAMEAFIKECNTIFKDTKHGPVRDAGIIALVQKIEHYAIATYGTLVTFGSALADDTIVDLLNKTLAEEKKVDNYLSEAAYKTINFDAALDENKVFASHYYRGKTM
jgi:ferritin-like metal-binding protein YciE